jgi:hypothetical protein
MQSGARVNGRHQPYFLISPELHDDNLRFLAMVALTRAASPEAEVHHPHTRTTHPAIRLHLFVDSPSAGTHARIVGE